MTTVSPTNKATSRIDLLTVATITVIVYLLAQLIHEGLGHGGMALLAGARVIQLTNTNIVYDLTGGSPAALRAIAAAGTVANIIVGLLVLWFLDRGVHQSANCQFFLWLLGLVNLLKGFGYLLITFAPIGDWHEVAQGLPGQTLWMIGLTLLGAITSLATFFYAVRTLDRFIGKGTDRRRRAFTLTLLPYLLGGTVNVLATIIGLGVTIYTFTGALATFGGTFLMVWLGLAVDHPRADTPLQPVTPVRDLGWWVAGFIALVFYLFWFGAGLIG